MTNSSLVSVADPLGAAPGAADNLDPLIAGLPSLPSSIALDDSPSVLRSMETVAPSPRSEILTEMATPRKSAH
jgi:hypothetical protein